MERLPNSLLLQTPVSFKYKRPMPSSLVTIPVAMERLPNSLLLQILSRLDDSADVARCRVAWKAFDTVFPGLRSINLTCPLAWLHFKPFKTVFLDHISKLETVESVCIVLRNPIDIESSSYYLTDGDFVKEWLARVSGSLISLSLSGDHYFLSQRQSNILTLISSYCHHLVNLSLANVRLSVHNLNPMPMLTTLTLSSIRLEDADLNEFNRCFPNLQVLNMEGNRGLHHPKIHLLNLKSCSLAQFTLLPFLTLITPNLITLKVVCMISTPSKLRVKAPMLSHFLLCVTTTNHARANCALTIVAKFENLKTLWLDCSFLGSLLSKFPVTKTLENLTLDSRSHAIDDSELTLGQVFTVFPNVTSLCINPGAWSELEACLNPEGWEVLDGRNGLKTIRAYLELVDPSLTFSYVSCVLDHCVGLLEVSLLIRGDVDDTVYDSFKSKCMVRWPRLKWRWGLWNKDVKDSWIADAISNSPPIESSKKRRL